MPLPSERLAPRRSLREDVTERVRELIVDGTLAPAESLRDAEIAEWLGVSRTPVREALLELRRSGLVQTTPGRATVVAPLDAAAIADARDVVAAMHRLITESAVPRLSADQVALMREINDEFVAAQRRGDLDAAYAADGRFHDVLVDVAGNDAARSVLDQYEPVLQRAERLRFASHRGQDSAANHARLIELCAAGDARAAADLAAHIWQSLEVPSSAHPSPTQEQEDA